MTRGWFNRLLWRMWRIQAPPAPPADLREARMHRVEAENELRYTQDRNRLIDRLVGNGPDIPSDDEFSRLIAATFQRTPRKGGA